MRRFAVGFVIAATLCGCQRDGGAPRMPEHVDTERPGVITKNEKPLTLVGPDLVEGSATPVLSCSIDTPVCEAQTGRMVAEEATLPPDTALLTISRDTPHAQKRFLEENHFSTKMASDFRDGSFGRGWGVLIKETGFLARSVWVIDKEGKVVYRELVRQQSTPPNYEALLKAVAQLHGSTSMK